MALLKFLRLPKKLSFSIRQVRGDSMLPAYKPGHIVIARPVSALRVGDVVIVRQDGRELLKRVQRMRPGQLYVVGDNAAQSTDSRDFGWVHVNAVIGRVLWPNSAI